MTRTRNARPIWQAYQDTGALAVDCPHCGATPGVWCSRPDGRLRRTPCLDRITATAPIPTPVPTPAHDFGEARRAPGAQR